MIFFDLLGRPNLRLQPRRLAAPRLKGLPVRRVQQQCRESPVTDIDEPPAPATDRQLMEWAIAFARRSPPELGRVCPMVGAVAARDGRPLGGAFRGEISAGEHAEFTLLEKKLAHETLAGASLFTTLEP